METKPLSPNLTEKLFSLIRCGLDLASETPDLSAEDLAALLPVGMKQLIQPILYRAIRRCRVPDHHEDCRRERMCCYQHAL